MTDIPHPSATLPAGSIFGTAGAYTIVRLVGRGGMGSVYLARQNSLGRDVALKVLDPCAGGGDESIIARFLAEPRLMVKFPNAAAARIVQVFDCGIDPGTDLPFYAMEAHLLNGDGIRAVFAGVERSVPREIAESLSDGGNGLRPLSLSDLLRDGHTIPDEPLARLALGIVQALKALHAAGIVHRDVKPSNLLFSASANPPCLFLADFGIAKDTSPDAPELTSADLRSQPGTQRYSAPEQRNGREAVPATDYYALGVVLFSALTGGAPGASAAIPPDCRTRCRRKWQRLFDGLLETDPAKRLHDPDAVAGMLRSIAATAKRRVLARKLRERHGKAIAVAAALVALAAAAIPAWRALSIERHAPGETRSIALPGGEELEMAWVPPGSFCVEGIGTTHVVKVTRGFWMARTETTRGQWRAVMTLAETGTDSKKTGPVPTGDDSSPMAKVSWMDCTNFIARANARIGGLALALPTEAEWELAARGPTGDGTAESAWHAGNSGKKTHPVRGLAPNGFGLFDMGGNVAEWCSDWNAEPRFGKSAMVRDPTGPAIGASRVFRGGSYLSSPGQYGASARSSAFPDTRAPYLGFRVIAR